MGMRCSELLQKRIGKGLPKRGEKIDYAAIRRKNRQESFGALFSLEKSKQMLSSLLQEIGRPDILVKDLLDVHLSTSSKFTFSKNVGSLTNVCANDPIRICIIPIM